MTQNAEISTERASKFKGRLWISLKLNILLSFAGNAWTALLGIVFVPLYLRYIGVEAYGIVGFFAGMQAILSILDLGLSASFSREIARLTAVETSQAAEMVRTLVKTLSAANWCLTALLALILIAISPVLAYNWVSGVSLSPLAITQCFLLISVSFAAYFPTGFYNAGLAGLRLQTVASIILLVSGTLRSVGALLVLAYISPTIQAYLVWQAVIAVAQLVATVLAFHYGLPGGGKRAATDFSLIRGLARFAAGNLAITVTGLVLSQMDRFVLGKLVSLEDFGYYSLATMISSTGLVMLVAAVSKVAYPQFSRIVALADDRSLRLTYHQSAQLVSLLVIPATVILAVYAREILWAWTGSESITERGSLILAFYSVGMGINCLLWLPNAMQLAHGWTRLTLYKNIAAIILFIPALYILVTKFGIVGGAIGWLTLNVFFFVAYVHLMHRRILKGEALRWYVSDVGLPLVAVLPTALLGKYAFLPTGGRIETAAFVALVAAAAVSAAALSLSSVRDRLFRHLFQNLRFKRV